MIRWHHLIRQTSFVSGLICLLLLIGPITLCAQQPDASSQNPPYAKLPEESNTYNYIVMAVMLAATMVIAFKKPKRAEIH